MDHKNDFLTDESDGFNAGSDNVKEDRNMMNNLEAILEIPEEELGEEAAELFLSLFPEEILDLTREAIRLEDQIAQADPLQASILKTKLDSIRRDIIQIMSEETDPQIRQKKLMS